MVIPRAVGGVVGSDPERGVGRGDGRGIGAGAREVPLWQGAQGRKHGGDGDAVLRANPAFPQDFRVAGALLPQVTRLG